MTTIEEIADRYDENGRRMILSAYNEAFKALEGRTRGNNHPFIEHPVGVADIVSREMALSSDCVTAILLHEANRFQGDNAKDLARSPMIERFKSAFPPDIIDIVLGLNNIAFITLQQTNLDEERYRKLIVSYSSDPRVVLIKLADRLEVMRNLSLLPPSKHKAKIMETILLYIPLSHQLGLYNIKSEMENLFLKYSEPEQYRSITNQLKAGEKDREKLITDFVRPLEAKLSAAGLHYTLKARTKSAYSIWKKMQAQKVTFDKVYDLFAIRFIIESPPQREIEHELCWKVYSLVTEEYQPDTNRLRDWLTVPKPSGYESLHTTVEFAPGVNVEVQIRTERMDFEAEQGNASHWAYKGIKSEDALSEWLNHVRDIMHSGSGQSYRQVSPTVLGEVFAFTPTGDLRQLPQGATVLDFAFDIHTNVGIKCTGGRINGKMVSFREQIKTGDVVEIITGRNQKPNQDWLNFVTTSKARSKIKQKLKEDQTKRADMGRELLDRRLRNWKLELSDEDLHELYKKYKYTSAIEFFADLGEGKVDVMDIKNFIQDESRHKPTPEGVDTSPRRQDREDSGDYLVIDGHLGNVDYRMAKCCNPIFGDEVFGFVTIREGIKIHRMSCPNAARLIDNYPYRIQKVKWKETSGKSSFQISLKVIAEGDMSVSSQVFSTVSTFKASVRSFNVQERLKGEQEITMQVYVPGNLELDKIIASLKKLKSIRQVTRL